MWTQENRHRYDRSKLRYPSDLTDEEWSQVAPLIPPAKRGGNKRTVDVREVVNGLMYILSTGCQWRAIPKDLPPRSTLHDYLELWDWSGTLARIHHALYVKCREQVSREASPTAAIIDSQSVKSGEKGGIDRPAWLRRRQECASTARIIYGGRFHPESCRLIWKLTSGPAGQLAGSKPRDKGRLGRPSDPAGRNGSEVRAGLEKVDAGADPSLARGRPRGQGSNRHMHLPGLPGYWTRHVGRVMRVIEGGPSGSEVATSTPLASGGLGRVSDRVIIPLKPGNAGGGKDPDFWCAFDDGKVRVIGDEP